MEAVRKIFQNKAFFVYKHKESCWARACSAFLLRNFATQLAPVWQHIFQASVDTHTIPMSWKMLHVKPLPKIPCSKEHKDVKPIALNSVIMKSLERILLRHFISATDNKLDPFQFAISRVWATEDTVASLDHIISKYLNIHAQHLSRFLISPNTIQTEILVAKMVQQELNPYRIHWYA